MAELLNQISSGFNANYSANWIRVEVAKALFLHHASFNANYSANWIRESRAVPSIWITACFNANYSANWIRGLRGIQLYSANAVSMLITVQIG